MLGKLSAASLLLLPLACGTSATTKTRTAPSSNVEMASSVSSGIFAGCRGEQSDKRATIECDDFVLVAISVDRSIKTPLALDQAILDAGIETSRSKMSIAGQERDVRGYELRNPGAKLASVNALVTAIPRADDLLVMHCGTKSSAPDNSQCMAAYEAFLVHGMPADVIAAKKHVGLSVDMVGQSIQFGAGCKQNKNKERHVQCEHGELVWEVADERSGIEEAAALHQKNLQKTLSSRGGSIKTERTFQCIFDLSPARCKESTIDLGMKQLGKLKLYTAQAELRGKQVFAACSFFVDKAPGKELPEPCKSLFDI